MTERLSLVLLKQRIAVKHIKSEEYDDIHSILRTQSHINNYLELEVQKTLLIKLISKQKL